MDFYAHNAYLILTLLLSHTMITHNVHMYIYLHLLYQNGMFTVLNTDNKCTVLRYGQYLLPICLYMGDLSVHVYTWIFLIPVQASLEEQAYHLLREWRERRSGTIYALYTILETAGITVNEPKLSPDLSPVAVAQPSTASTATSELDNLFYIYMYVHVYTFRMYMYMYVS